MRMQMTLDTVMIDWMLNELQNGRFAPETEEQETVRDLTILDLRRKTQHRYMLTKADYIGSVDGLDFYEHPYEGDHAPLMVHHPEIGFCKIDTPWYDLPDEDDVLTWFEEEIKNI